jgi:hypothetical protein
MPLTLQPVPRETASFQRLDALLSEAILIADLLGLDLAAIRIADAAAAMRGYDSTAGGDMLLMRH